MVGSCLKNQIEDYHMKDMENMKNGKQPNYWISSKGEFYDVQMKGDSK